MKNWKTKLLSLSLLLAPLFLSAQLRTLTHIEHSGGGHNTSTVINYKTWDGTGWWARIEGNTFIHSRNHDFSNSHQDDIINYLYWDNSKWTARVNGDTWTHAPNGDFNSAHRSACIMYKTPQDGLWTATFEGYASFVAEGRTIYHTRASNNNQHSSKVINYRAWDGTSWYAKIIGETFTHSHDQNFSGAHQDEIINYLSWDDSRWTARVVGATWLHAPEGDFNKAHQSAHLNYQSATGERWSATLYDFANNSLIVMIEPMPEPEFVQLFEPQPPIVISNYAPPAYRVENGQCLMRDLGLEHSIGPGPGQEAPMYAPMVVDDLAHDALNIYAQHIDAFKAQLPAPLNTSLNAGNLRDYIRSHADIRAAVNGVLFSMILDRLANASDNSPEAVALREWIARLYTATYLKIAQNTMDEYTKWKNNPCYYNGRQGCAGSSYMNTLAGPPSPPMNEITGRGFDASFNDANLVAGALSISAAAAGVAIGGSILTGAMTAGGSLASTFGVAGTAAAPATSAIGMGTVWAGPAGIIAAGIVIGVLQTVNVVQAANFEKKLTANLLAAKMINTFSPPTVIGMVLGNEDKTRMLYAGFVNLTIGNI